MCASRKPAAFDRDVGKNLVARRKALGLSQAEVARQIGVSTQQYGKYERGETRLSLARNAAISRLFREGAVSAPRPGFAEETALFAPTPAEVAALMRALSAARDEIDRAIALSRRF